MKRNILVLLCLSVVLAFVLGCASAPEPRIETAGDCSQYGLFDMPAHAELLGREPMPSACHPNPSRGYGDTQRVVVVDGDTGGYRIYRVPHGTVVAK